MSKLMLQSLVPAAWARALNHAEKAVDFNDEMNPVAGLEAFRNYFVGALGVELERASGAPFKSLLDAYMAAHKRVEQRAHGALICAAAVEAGRKPC